MFINSDNDMNNINVRRINFRNTTQVASELVTKPIEKVETVITSTVDSFVKEPQDEEKKKSHKAAITAGSSALVITAIIALLNPQFSGKLIKKLQDRAQKAGKNSYVLKNTIDFLQFINTVNATKDVGFKWLCAEEKFNNIKNEPARKILKKIDSGLRAVTSKLHNFITKGFDKISRLTVYKKYALVGKKMDSFDELLKTYRGRLTPQEQEKFVAALDEINTARGFFTRRQTALRLKAQERAMSGLEKNFMDKLVNDYCANFKGFKSEGSFTEKWNYNLKHVKNNMSFWAEDMLMPYRNTFEEEGHKAVTNLVGDGVSVKGKYHNVIDVISPHLNKDEKALLNKELEKVQKKLMKANSCECIEYFDKKRDLILGGAPTDILTGAIALGLSGVAISNAEDKQERVSKALTLGFPAIAGIGANFAFAAMLYSGFQSLAYGALTSAGLSMIGSKADKHLNPRIIINNKQSEVQNV